MSEELYPDTYERGWVRHEAVQVQGNHKDQPLIEWIQRNLVADAGQWIRIGKESSSISVNFPTKTGSLYPGQWVTRIMQTNEFGVVDDDVFQRQFTKEGDDFGTRKVLYKQNYQSMAFDAMTQASALRRSGRTSDAEFGIKMAQVLATLAVSAEKRVAASPATE